MSFELHNGDNVTVLKTFEDECIGLTVTSPPYDNLRTYKGFSWDFEQLASELYRVTKKGGVVVWVVGDATINGSETGTSFMQALHFKQIGFNLHDTMIWEKPNAMPLTHNRYDPAFEYMFVLSKGRPKVFSPLRESSQWAGAIKKRYLENKSAIDAMSASRQRDEETVVKADRYRKNVWKCVVGVENERETGSHPAIFPESLAKDHILSWSNEGDTVLDPFCGSGTTGKMALLNNRKFIGIEISSEYCEIARTRIENVIQKEPLFA